MDFVEIEDDEVEGPQQKKGGGKEGKGKGKKNCVQDAVEEEGKGKKEEGACEGSRDDALMATAMSAKPLAGDGRAQARELAVSVAAQKLKEKPNQVPP